MERRLQCQHDCWRFLTCEERTRAHSKHLVLHHASVSFASLGKTTKETDSVGGYGEIENEIDNLDNLDSSSLSACQPHGVCGLPHRLMSRLEAERATRANHCCLNALHMMSRLVISPHLLPDANKYGQCCWAWRRRRRSLLRIVHVRGGNEVEPRICDCLNLCLGTGALPSM